MPHVVTTGEQNVFLGEAHFEPYDPLYATGEGAKVAVYIRLYGTTTVDGSEQYVDQEGIIVISTSDWNGLARPDSVNVTYSWKNSTQDPVNVTLPVPPTMATRPDDLHFVYGISKGEIGATCTTSKDIAETTAGYMLEGIFWVHEKLFDWATGHF